jgi:hypothetical protein
MRCRPFDTLMMAVVLSGASGCVESTRVGLDNARAREWHQERIGKGPDVIANADDSCERGGSDRPDPMPVRFYKCPGRPAEGTRLAGPR